ncbi:MAG TPA: penicillin-binding transpeptidase domain-containing protein, partial [Acidobacteriota bacterium]|nr:penicillin-binding transpeptidase domain-containing protein [Acidobacteriota bacterium]
QAENGPLPQVALVALDPRSGEIKALVGSRDYAHSQLNRTLARRQPGSVFKPFVYAAAFETAIERRGPRFTPLSTVIDEPTVFRFDGGDYEPGNYGRKYQGNVTLREALAQSLNIATVKVAEETGYDRVVRFAERTGIRSAIRPTPALALGAYEMTPLDVAGGYTIFAANGTRSEPFFLKRVRRSGNGVILDNRPQRRAALDPRVAYLVTNILEDVVTRGTGTIVRSRGFTLPAAGKTGTSHDGWFAGYTTSLLCVVWVGFDDNRELNLSGAASAGLIWTEFMKKAARLPAYADPGGFIAPAGVISMTIDAESLMPARPECPVAREEVFIAGTEPDRYCTLHGGGFLEKIRPDSWLRRLFRRGS